MDAFPVGKRSQVVMTAHQFADPAPEPGVHFQQTLDLRGSVFICAVKTAAERMESLPDLLRGGKKFICQNVIGSRIIIASAVITQIVRRPFFHQIIPFFSHGHAENNRFGNTCCIHGSYQGGKPSESCVKSRKCRWESIMSYLGSVFILQISMSRL